MWCLAHQGLENQINFAESSHLGTDLRIDWGWKPVASHNSGVRILLSKYGQEKEFGVVPEFFQCDIGSEFGEWCRAQPYNNRPLQKNTAYFFQRKSAHPVSCHHQCCEMPTRMPNAVCYHGFAVRMSERVRIRSADLSVQCWPATMVCATSVITAAALAQQTPWIVTRQLHCIIVSSGAAAGKST